MAESETQDFLESYQHATKQLFRYYAASRRQKLKTLKRLHKKDVHVGDKDFEAMQLEHLQAKSGRLDREWRRDSSKQTVSYDDFFKFILDFDLPTSLALSSIEMGTVYLSAIHKRKTQGFVRNLTHDDFQRALVYCAIVAYEKKMKAYEETPDRDIRIQTALKAHKENRVSTCDKIRSLFLHMWRAVHDEKNIPSARVHMLNVNTHAMDIFNAAKKFREKFHKEWQDDGYRDYLNPVVDGDVDDEMILDEELKMLTGPGALRSRKQNQTVALSSSGERFSQKSSSPLRDSFDRKDTMSSPPVSYDAASMETIRDYLDTRPELRGLLDTNNTTATKGGSSDMSFLTEIEDESGNSSQCKVSLSQYEKAMAALKSDVPLGAFD